MVLGGWLWGGRGRGGGAEWGGEGGGGGVDRRKTQTVTFN